MKNKNNLIQNKTNLINKLCRKNNKKNKWKIVRKTMTTSDNSFNDLKYIYFINND